MSSSGSSCRKTLCSADATIKMGWATEMKVLLIVLVFLKWPLTTDTVLQEPSLAGMPLSDAEYESFFETLRAHHILHAACIRRALFGCHDPTIQALDRHENHGIIPNGGICSDLPDNASFPGFCSFALYRCTVKKYFAKRVLCPDETMQKSAVTKTNLEVTPDNIVIPTAETSSELPDITTSTESFPKLLATMETAAFKISTTPLPTTTAQASLVELLSSSAVEMAAKVISHILAAYTATTKPSSESATSAPLMELTPASTATATPKTSSKLTTTAELVIELTSTAAIITESKVNPATTATIPASTWVTTAAPTESLSELATAMELLPDSTSDTTESFFDPTIHTTTTTSNTEACIVDYPEPLDTSTTSTSPTTATSSTSILPTHPATTPTEAAADTSSSRTTASSQPFVPGFEAPLLFPPPQPNGTMHILILSFVRNKKAKDGDTTGISALPQTRLGSGNILQQEEMQNPLPTNGLKDLFLRLRDKSVQRLMQKMQDAVSGE